MESNFIIGFASGVGVCIVAVLGLFYLSYRAETRDQRNRDRMSRDIGRHNVSRTEPSPPPAPMLQEMSVGRSMGKSLLLLGEIAKRLEQGDVILVGEDLDTLSRFLSNNGVYHTVESDNKRIIVTQSANPDIAKQGE